jgi:hypothetical protein
VPENYKLHLLVDPGHLRLMAIGNIGISLSIPAVCLLNLTRSDRGNFNLKRPISAAFLGQNFREGE